MEGHTRVQWIHFPGEGVLREKAVFLARKDMHFVPVYQRHCQCLGVHFRTGIVPHGVAVNDQDDLHWGWSPKRYKQISYYCAYNDTTRSQVAPNGCGIRV